MGRISYPHSNILMEAVSNVLLLEFSGCPSENTPMHKNFIRELRKREGLTLQEVAEKLGTSNQQVSNHETGKRKLNWEWIQGYARVLNCHPLEIMEGPNEAIMPKNDIQKKILEAMNQMSDREQQLYGAGFLSGLTTPDAATGANNVTTPKKKGTTK